ncbi:MAG: hypothetical protein ACFFD7_17265 [Candidatus Thorarchaeota archaeon]
MALVDILHGTFSLIYVLISFAIGFIILFKYIKFRNRLYILVGLTWIFLSFPWLPDSISFIMNLTTQSFLPTEWYFIIGNAFIPIALIAWIIAYTDMINKERQKLAVGLILALSIVFEITFFTLFFINIDLIGVIDPLTPFSADLGIFLIVFLLITMLIILITGLQFSIKSIQSENREVRLKGKLLRGAFIAFSIAAFLEKSARSIMLGLVFQNPSDLLLTVMLAIVRVVLVLSAFAFYGGFLLPRWMKEIFLKKE